jgi:hypothetical protein
MQRLLFQYNDGGRTAAGYRGKVRDCATRAIAIATQSAYEDIYRALDWTATMLIGSGCKVHLRSGELPSGRLIVAVSKHLCAVIDGVLHDTHDCSRGGRRCVYGYWTAT